MEQESQFGMTPEEIERLRRVQKEEQQAADEGGITPLSEVSRMGEKELSENAKPLALSQETLLLIEEGGRVLSERQLKLIALTSYFYEQQVAKTGELLSGKHPGFYRKEDFEEIDNTLRLMTERYEDILDRKEEYPAARAMIKEVQQYLEGIEKLPIAQHIAAVWHNIASRIEGFNQILLLKSAESEEAKEHALRFLTMVKAHVVSRIPTIVPGPLKEELQKGPTRGLQRIRDAVEKSQDAGEARISEEDEARIYRELDDAFKELNNYYEEHLTYESIDIRLPTEFVNKMRNELIELVNEKGTAEGTLNRHGKKLLLSVDDSNIEVWHPGEPLPLHITIVDRKTQVGSYISLEENGGASTGINVFDDVPATQQELEEARKLQPDFWEKFITAVVEKAREL